MITKVGEQLVKVAFSDEGSAIGQTAMLGGGLGSIAGMAALQGYDSAQYARAKKDSLGAWHKDREAYYRGRERIAAPDRALWAKYQGSRPPQAELDAIAAKAAPQLKALEQKYRQQAAAHLGKIQAARRNVRSIGRMLGRGGLAGFGAGAALTAAGLAARNAAARNEWE